MRFGNVLCSVSAAAMLLASLPTTAIAESVQTVTVEKTYGESFTQGDLKYTEKSDGTLEVSANDKNIKSAIILETVNGKKVTSIGNGAFADCKSLTSVTIPNSVTSISDSAFMYCEALSSVTIPNSVASIGDSAFMYCEALSSVTIPNSVTSINKGAFWHCEALTSVTIPDSVTSIGKSAFGKCSGLTSVTIPNSVTSIGDSAFIYCEALSSVTIPNSVTSIDEGAFAACFGLTSVTVPNSVTSIGKSAFAACFGLTSVTIPNSVTSIDINAFYNNLKLKDIYYGGTEEQWKKLLADNKWDGSISYLDSDYTEKTFTPTVHYNSSAPAAPSGTNKRGDFDNNGEVDLNDISTMLKKYLNNGASDLTLDYNGDGNVDLTDISQLLSDYLNGKIK